MYVNNILFISTLGISQPKPYFSCLPHDFIDFLRTSVHVIMSSVFSAWMDRFSYAGRLLTTGLRLPKTWYQQGIWTFEPHKRIEITFSGPRIGSVPSRKPEALEKHIAIWRDPRGWWSKKTGASPGHFLIQVSELTPVTNQLLTNSGN